MCIVYSTYLSIELAMSNLDLGRWPGIRVNFGAFPHLPVSVNESNQAINLQTECERN